MWLALLKILKQSRGKGLDCKQSLLYFLVIKSRVGSTDDSYREIIFSSLLLFLYVNLGRKFAVNAQTPKNKLLTSPIF